MSNRIGSTARSKRILTAGLHRWRRFVHPSVNLLLELLEQRENPTPVPSIVGLPGAGTTQPLLGDAVTYSFSYANTGDATGFAPFIELAVDTSGPDGAASLPRDGIGTPTISAAGLPLSAVGSITLTPGQTTYVNPLTGEVRTISSIFGAGRFGTNDTIFIYSLPFGSFTAAQSTGVTVTLPTSSLADVNGALPLSLVGGFRDNDPSLNGPGIYGPTASTDITPQLYRLNKIYTGPENETATGPNFIRHYRLEVDVATGQTVTNLRVSDDLASSMQIVGKNTTNMAAFVYASAGNQGANTFVLGSLSGSAIATAPDGTLTYNFGSKTGVAGPDAAFEFDFYVPRDQSAAGTPPNGATVPQGTDSTTGIDTASSLVNWVPTDVRDGAQTNLPPAASGSVLSHTLEQQSIAIQKSVQAIDPATGLAIPAGSPIRPGQTLLRYTLNFQVSDYFAVDSVFVRDVLGDGQRLYLDPIAGNATAAFPTLSVQNAFLTGSPNGSRVGTAGGFQGAGVIDYQQRYTSQAGLPPGTSSDPTAGTLAALAANPVFTNSAAAFDGTTRLQFDLTKELQARLGATAGRLVGGEISNAGVGPTNNPIGSQQFGGTTGTLVFYTLVNRDFSDAFPSGDRSVDQGDVLNNVVDDPTVAARDGIFGDQLAAATIDSPTPTIIGRGSDDSATSLAIPYGLQTKQIYAINGLLVPAQSATDPPFSAQPGDRITYRLTYTLPISSFEQLKVIDFPPLPVMAVNASAPYTFVRNPAAYTFAAGQIGVLDAAGVNPTDDTYFATFDPALAGLRDPAISTVPANNQLTLDFGTQDDVQRRSTQISLLVTFQVSNDPFANDLFLTNQLRVIENSTNAGAVTVEDLRRFELVRPFVTVNKGVVGANGAGSTLGGITFTAPGTAANFSGGPIDTAAEATAIGAANASNVDAGDTVRFAIVVQNTGKGDAFDITLQDQIPAGYVVPATFLGLNPVIKRGDGTTLVLGVDYTLTSYDNTTGTFVINLVDNYTAGNIGGATEDARSGAVSRGQRTDQVLGNQPITNGSNTVVILYDLTLSPTITPNIGLVNTASATTYSNSEGGPDLTDPAVVPGATDPLDPATVTSALPTQAKTLIGTEITDPGNAALNQATIGEFVTYEVTVTIPEGVTPAAAIVDQLDLGLSFVDIDSTFIPVVTPGLISSLGVLTAATLTANLSVAAGGGTVTFNLGTLTNNINANNAGTESITFRYRVVVLNTNGASGSANNQAGQLRNNAARFTWTGNAATLAQVSANNVTIVEPTLTATKQVRNGVSGTFAATVQADAGDTIQYQIAIANGSAATDTTAHEVTLSDTIPSQVQTPTVVSATSTGIIRFNGVARAIVAATDLVFTGSVLTFAAGLDVDMDPGSSITIIVQGAYTGATGITIPNTADVRWTSLEGNISAARTPNNAASVERTGAGGPGADAVVLNNYAVAPVANIEAPPLVRKTIVATSETASTQASPTSAQGAIGEIIRYRVVVSLGEGTTRNFQLRDALPAGLAFINDGSARFALLSTGGNDIASTGITSIPAPIGGGVDTASIPVTAITSADIIGTFTTGNVATGLSGAGTVAGTPTFYSDGQAVFFRFGDLANTDNDADNEFVVVEFNAIVSNVVGNQAATALNNTFAVLVDTNGDGVPGFIPVVIDSNGNGVRDAGDIAVTANDPANNATGTTANSNLATVTVVEPALQIVKQVIATTGSVVTYRVTVANAALATATTGFNSRVVDILNGTTLTLVPGSVTTAIFSGGASGFTNNTIGNTIDVAIDVLPPGSNAVFTYQANVLSTPTGATTLNNTANSSTTSLNANGGVIPIPGNATPANPRTAAGTATGERTGADGVGGALNDYAMAASQSLGSLGDFVWVDVNGNGVQDAGEPGIPNAPVIVRWAGPDGIFNNADDSVTNTTTNASGIYTVTGLPVGSPGQYRVNVTTTGAPFTTFGLNTQTFDATAPPTDSQSQVDLTVATPNPRNQDFGYRGTASIGDRVWHDLNANGIQDAGEPGIPAVGITVIWLGFDGAAGGGDDVVYNTTTNASGIYTVSNLPAGNFTVTVNTATLPDNFIQTFDLDGLATANTAARTLAPAEAATDVDFGYRGNATLGDRVWYDVDGDGVLDNVLGDGFEPGLPGVTITLTFGGDDGDLATAADNITYTTITDATGNYLFSNLFGGDFNGANPNYRVVATPLAAFPTQTYDATAPTTDSTSTLQLANASTNLLQDFGYRGPSTQGLGNFVWEDLNGNGRQDGGEPGLGSVTVELWAAGADAAFNTADDVQLDVTTTNGAGIYSFPNLASSAAFGPYQVRVQAPAGYVFTTQTSAVATTLTDSNVAQSGANVGRTPGIVLPAATIDNSIDAGLYRLVSLGDRVFLDQNGDGVQQGGEPGIVGAAITVTWLGPDGVLGGGDDLVFNTTTAANGLWSVGNLPPGNFSVSVTPPLGSGLNTLTDSIDNGVLNASNPVVVTTASGVNRTDVDFGYRGTGSLGDRVYHDINGDGIQQAGEPGLPGVTITLTWAGLDGTIGTADDATYSTITGANGVYGFANLPAGTFRVDVSTATLPLFAASTDVLDDGILTPGNSATVVLATAQARTDVDFGYRGNATIGDLVWYDVDGDGVLDNVLGDGFEPGIPGVTITLTFGGRDGDLTTAADNLIYTTTTNATGNYLVPNLFGGDFNGANPNYRVVASPQAAYPTQTFDATAPTTDSTSTLQLANASTNLLQDFGYRGPATQGLGNFVWEDLNGNGRQDGGEPGLASVTVELWAAGVDGNFNTADDVQLDVTTTNGAGIYSFPNLAASAAFGPYQVRVQAPTGYVFTTQTSPVATTLTDSNVVQSGANAGRTPGIALPAATIDNSIDAGLYRPVTLGDRVWFDTNNDTVQNAGEPGIPGATVTVTWFGPDGVLGGGDDLSFPTTTGANGIWTVANLPPGNYSVAITNLPADLIPTFDLDGTATPSTALVTSISGQTRTDVDFGYRGFGSVGDRVFLDVNANGSYDPGEGLDGVTVTLQGDLNADGTPETLTTTTAADGFYQFVNLRTAPGGVTYVVTIVTATLPQQGNGTPIANTTDPDTAGTGNNTSSIPLTTTVPSNQNQDFGYRGPGSIGDTIFLDANNNGLPDAGEGITGVAITLSADVDGDGTAESFSATTDAAGLYLFANLPVRTSAGALISYTVTVGTGTLPSGVTNTTDPDTVGTGDNTSSLTLNPVTPTNLVQDFGYRGPGSIGDRVFLDLNGDGLFTAGEGLFGITVTLRADVNGDGLAETFTTSTDADGFYSFTGLPVFQANGTTTVSYVVTVVSTTLPTGVNNVIDPDGGNNNTSSLTLNPASPVNLAQDFGYRGTGSLGDRIWIDANGDGIQGPISAEPGLPGVGLALTWAGPDGIFGNADDVTTSTNGNATGIYGFANLPPGLFRVDVVPATLPGNVAPTFDLDGIVTAHSATANLTLGQARTDVDFGYQGNAALGDRVWIDQDRNGVQAATEPGIPGATLLLVWSGPDSVLGNADDVTFTGTTGANGAYLFPGLPVFGASQPYRVTVTSLPLGGFIPTFDLDSGLVAPDQSAVASVASSGANQNRRDADFGYSGTSSLAGNVFRDDNNDGVQNGTEPGIVGVTVTLTGVDPFGNPVLDPATGQPYTTTTDANGNYSFAGLVTGVFTLTETQPAVYSDGLDRAGTLGGNAVNDVISGINVGPSQAGTAYTFGERGQTISGTVFRDDNRDGSPQVGEPGIGGVRVELRDPITNNLIAFTPTDASGNYSFLNLPAGNYRIVEIQPANYADSPVGSATISNVTLTTAGLTGQNFGEILGSISGAVYLDSNGNGQRDGGEPGLGGVAITLTGSGSPIVQTTAPDGTFFFNNLIPASYQLDETQPAGYGQGTNAAGTVNGTTTGTAGPTTDRIGGIAIAAGQSGVNYLFGEIAPVGTFLAGTVYLDRDGNGQPGGPGESGIAGVTIELLDPAGNIVGTTSTGPGGSYIFTGIKPGPYTIRETQPVGYGSSTPNLLSVTVPAAGLGGQNFGETLGGLSGAVYFDRNRDGTQQAGEPGIAGVVVTLSGTDASGNPVNATTTTDARGNYSFTDLPAGTYIVTETQPAGYTDGQESIGSVGGALSPTDAIASIPLGAGVSAFGYNFGEVGVPVSGTVFRDDNKDGINQNTEPGIPGVTVQLFDPNGNVIATTITDASGNYTFPNVPPGNYTLVEVQPSGYGDPPVGPFAPNNRPIMVAATPITSQNFGDTLSSLAGSVFVDSNGNGTLQGGEPGIGGVPMRLDSAGPDGTFGTADDVTGFRTTTTDASGNYSFTNLPTGVYRVVETTQPAPFLDGQEAAGPAGGTTTINDQIGDIPLAAGTDLAGYTFGELPPGPLNTTFIAGTVYLDSNNNGVQDSGELGLAGVAVAVTDGVNPPIVVTTDANGNYTATGLTPGTPYTVTETQPGAYTSGPQNVGNVVAVTPPAAGVTGINFGETPGTISGTVYFDRNASATFNGGDTPLTGVTVTLLDGNGNTVNNPLTGQPYVLTTAIDGTYSFTNLAAGSYRVVETQPAGYNQGTNAPGAFGSLGGADRIDVTLPAGGASPANTFGELGAGISGTVFLDANADGVHQPGETTGVGGVTITLLDANGNVVGTTITNPNGTYAFTNLPPGNYTLLQTQPAAYGSTTTNVIPVSLTPAGVANQDFGETLATLRGNVFADTNNSGGRDPGEAGISGVTVTLTGTDVNGNDVNRTATTDSNGDYAFTDLPAGTYTITESQPAAFTDGKDAVGTAGGSLAPTDSVVRVPVGAGSTPTGYNFGEVTSSLAGFVYRDFNLNGSRTPSGANPDTGISGITIVLTGTDSDRRPVNRVAITAADGSYLFDGLGGGTYTIAETQPPLPTTLTNGFYDGADNPGSLGGSIPIKNQLSVTLGVSQNGAAYNFGELPPADPFGFVYVDLNRNGIRDAAEPGIANVAITIGGTAFSGTQFARPLTATDIPGGSLTVRTNAAGRWEYSPIPPGLYTITEAQPAGFADGPEQDGDPSGPPTTITNDTFANLLLAPFPVRGPFNFGEVLLPAAPPGALPPIDFFPVQSGTDISKRAFLGSTTDTQTVPILPTSPNFAAFNPGGQRPTAFASVTNGSDGWVRVFDFAAGNERFRFRPFGDFAGGTRLTTADLTGDGIPDIIAVPGAGGGPIVRVFDGNTGAPIRSWLAFDPDFRGGLQVAAADVTGDGVADVIVTPDGGGGPIVRVFDGLTNAMVANFFALDPGFRGGLRIATGDVNHDGTADLIVTAGAGGGPRVAVYDGTSLTSNPTRLAGDFFTFAPDLRSGSWVTSGDVDGDGFADIIVGSGDGGAPRVVVYSGRILTTGGGAREIASFFAGDPATRGGARVLAADLDGDGKPELLSTGGAGLLPIVYIFDPRTGLQRDAFYGFPTDSIGGAYLG